MSESLRERRRRKFAAGVLDQLASLTGSVAGAAIAAGVVAPIVAAAIGSIPLTPAQLAPVAMAAGLVGAALGAAAVWLKGSSKRLDDDAGRPEPERPSVEGGARLSSAEEPGDV